MDKEELARLLVDLKAREGSWRVIERRSGVSNASLSLMARGTVTPQQVTIHRLALAYPDLADRLYALTGYEPVIGSVPGLAELAQKLEQPADKVIEMAVRRMADEVDRREKDG